MRTVITGGCGFIGTSLALRLLKSINKSDEIILIDTMQRHGAEMEPGLLSSHQVRIIQANLLDPNCFEMIPSPVDRVYHLAAIVGVKRVEADPVNVMRNNTISTIHILDWFINNRTEDARFLFSSSSEIYSGATIPVFNLPIPTPEDVPAAVTDLSNPRFSYALTKIWGEAYVNYIAQKDNIFSICVRYHNVYGPRMGYDHVIPQVFLRILSKETPFRVMAVEQTRSFCWIDDAVKATHLLMEADNIEPGTVVHIGNEHDEIEIGKLYELLFTVCSWRPEKVLKVSTPSGSVNRRCPDTERLRELTGYTPNTPLKEGIKKTWAWYSNNARKTDSNCTSHR